MAELQWIKFSPSDWLTGTRGLSAAETGVYITLCMMMYENGGPIGQTTRLHRQCGASDVAFCAILSDLIDLGKIQLVDGMLFNERVGVELASFQSRISKAKVAAEVRWEKDKEKQGPIDASALRMHEPSNANRIEEIREEKKEKKEQPTSLRSVSPSPSKAKGTRLSSEWVLPKSFGDWALEKGLPRDRILVEADKMRNWSINAGRVGVKVDWFAAWQNWVMKALDELPRTRTVPIRPLTRIEQMQEDLRRRIADEQHEQDAAQGSNLETDGRFPRLALESHGGRN